MLKGLILGILLGILLVAGGVYFYFSSGRAPVATSAPPIPFEKTLARLGLHAYLDKLPHPEPQAPADEANLVSGAKVYKEQCATCHGLPNEPKTAVAQGMFPAPPQLFHGVGVTDDDAWESYWKVENGIRMSGMPGEECGQNHGIREKGARRRRDYTDGNGHARGQSGAEEEIDSTRRIKAPGCGAFQFFAIQENTKTTRRLPPECRGRPAQPQARSRTNVR